MWIFSNILLLSSISADINDEFDAHACGKEDAALQATRTRRSGTRSVP